MKPLHLVLGALAVVALAAGAGIASTASSQDAPTLGADHGEYIRFVIDHADSKKGLVNGGFSKFEQVSGKVDVNKLAHSKAVYKVDLTSIATGIPKRDGHLKSPDFFDVSKYTHATITVDKVNKAGDKHTARVTLDLHGVKKSFEVGFKVVKELDNGLVIEGSTDINRRHYNVGAAPERTGAAEVAKVNVRLAVINK